MEFLSKTLILDNFRSVLKGYSVDVQDVVRSAILDGLDVSEYIRQCASDPYRLDQIRLGMKEGLDPFFFSLGGGLLYKVRGLVKKGINLSYLKSQLGGTLSEEHMEYLIKWINEGYSVERLNISIIPAPLLGVFDYGLKSDVDVSIYNTGKNFPEEYMRKCITMQKNGRDVSVFLKDSWNMDVLNYLCVRSSQKLGTWWEKLLKVIDSGTPVNRSLILCDLSKTDLDLGVLQRKSADGEYVFSYDCLCMIKEALSSGLNYKILLNYPSATEMRVKLQEMKVQGNAKIKGVLHRKI